MNIISAHGATPPKELFEGEDAAVAKKEAKLEYADGLDDVNEEIWALLSGTETRLSADHYASVSLPFRHTLQGAGYGRV